MRNTGKETTVYPYVFCVPVLGDGASQVGGYIYGAGLYNTVVVMRRKTWMDEQSCEAA
jgi:hypothetical protein